MSVHRTNKSNRGKGDTSNLPWFINSSIRSKKRSKIAKLSRRKNRGK